MFAITFGTNRRIVFGKLAVVTAALGLMGVISGCGGASGASNGGANTAALAPESGFNDPARSFITRAVGTIQPPVFVSNGPATLYGMFGASFTTINYNFPNPQNGALNLISATGRLGTGCAGFLVSLENGSVSNIMAFDTVDTTVAGRSAVRVTPLSEGETQSHALVVSIKDSSGGNLSRLKFIVASTAVAPVFTMNLNANEALVAFGPDGRLLHVIPFAATRAGLPQSRKVAEPGDVVTIAGPFKNIWNAEGSAVAPTEAASIRINTRTGELVGWQ